MGVGSLGVGKNGAIVVHEVPKLVHDDSSIAHDDPSIVHDDPSIEVDGQSIVHDGPSIEVDGSSVVAAWKRRLAGLFRFAVEVDAADALGIVAEDGVGLDRG